MLLTAFFALDKKIYVLFLKRFNNILQQSLWFAVMNSTMNGGCLFLSSGSMYIGEIYILSI